MSKATSRAGCARDYKTKRHQASVKLARHSTILTKKKMIRIPAALSILLQLYINVKRTSACSSFLVPEDQNRKNVLTSQTPSSRRYGRNDCFSARLIILFYALAIGIHTRDVRRKSIGHRFYRFPYLSFQDDFHRAPHSDIFRSPNNYLPRRVAARAPYGHDCTCRARAPRRECNRIVVAPRNENVIAFSREGYVVMVRGTR